MAALAGVAAMSHIPRMANAPDAPGAAIRDEVAGAFAAIGNELRALAPSMIVTLAPDHFQNFFIDNMPALCIGCGEAHLGPAEPWIKDPPRSIPGAADLARHLLAHCYASGFDPAFSHQLRLDHGYVLPLRAAGFAMDLPLLPIVVNAVQPPFPHARRLFAFGRMLADAIAAYDANERVLLVASGGLSHSIAEPGMGRVDEAFDREFLARLTAGATDSLADWYEAGVPAAGNGSQEMRHWMIAHGAAGGRGFAARYYRPIPEWYLGVCIGAWRL